MIHLNACKIEKFKIWNFSHIPVSTNFFSFTWVKYGWAQGTPHTKYMSYPLPEYLSTDEDWIAEGLNASLLVPQEIYGRVLKWTQLSQVPDECLSQNLTLPYHTLFLFLSNIFSKHSFVWFVEISGLSLLQAPQNFTLYGFFFPLCTLPIYWVASFAFLLAPRSLPTVQKVAASGAQCFVIFDLWDSAHPFLARVSL